MELKVTPRGTGEKLQLSNGLEINILVSGDSTNGTISVFEDTVPPGAGPPRHIHNNQDETFHVMEGTFKAEVDGNEVILKPGDVAFVPRGSVHAFKNIGDAGGVIRYSFTPAAGAEALLRGMANAPVDASHEQLTAIAAKHDNTVVGLPL